MLAAFDLLVGPLEQHAERIIGDQRCLAALGALTGEPRHRHRGGFGPGMLWHRIVGVMAQLTKRFDGDETA
ncbi:hypothetical protein D3C76_1431920 [compost metagenome]